MTLLSHFRSCSSTRTTSSTYHHQKNERFSCCLENDAMLLGWQENETRISMQGGGSQLGFMVHPTIVANLMPELA